MDTVVDSIGAKTICHTFTETGQYDVSLTVSQNGACPTTSRQTGLINIHPEPDAAFDISYPALIPDDGSAFFLNLSMGASYYYWNFGDGNTSSEESPIHRYRASLPFDVILVAENEFGCTDTAKGKVNVKCFGFANTQRYLSEPFGYCLESFSSARHWSGRFCHWHLHSLGPIDLVF